MSQDSNLCPVKGVLLIAAILLCHSRWASGEPLVDNYLCRLRNTITQTRSNLTLLTKSANHAADEFVSGANLWVAGQQADFIAEASGRAGGLMSIVPLGQQTPTNHDIVLYAVPGSLDPQVLKTVGPWQEKGATVVTFSSAAGLYGNHFPIDTVANVVNLWAWTGEFVAACTRLGKMPVLYQSYGLPGGPERGKRYQGKRFHEDLAIKPISAGILGREVLGSTRSYACKDRRHADAKNPSGGQVVEAGAISNNAGHRPHVPAARPGPARTSPVQFCHGSSLGEQGPARYRPPSSFCPLYRLSVCSSKTCGSSRSNGSETRLFRRSSQRNRPNPQAISSILTQAGRSPTAA